MLCAQHVRNGFLGRRLSRRPGHGNEGLSPQPADGGSKPLQREKRILYRQQLILLRKPRALVLGNDSADCALGERCLDEIMPVQPIATNREEQIAWQQGPRINGISGGDRGWGKLASSLHEFGGAR